MTEDIHQQINILEKHLAAYPNSPLFARLAGCYLNIGRAREALTLCDSGLALYPYYTTGHLIKGKALAALQMYAEARREFEFVKQFLPTLQTIEDLLTGIPQTEESAFTSSPEKESIPPTTSPPVEEQLSLSSTPGGSPTMEAPEAPDVAESLSPFDQLQTMIPHDAPAQATAGMPTDESPEEAFSQLQTSAASIEETQSVDPFGVGIQMPEEGWGGMDTMQQPPAETPSSSMETAGEESESPFAALRPDEESPFASLDQQPSVPMGTPNEEISDVSGIFTEEESFEQYAQRMRTELGGFENTMSLEEYLKGSSTPDAELIPLPSTEQRGEESAPAEEKKNEIEEITEKLQSAKKITPIINLADKTTHSVTEAETPASTGFVTPTLAEIYAKQGWYDDAIKAYRTLMVTKPAEREKFEKRIKELEKLKAQQGGESG